MSCRNVTILGSTGSIGCSTLEVIALHPKRFKVYALTAYSRTNEMVEQCQRFLPTYAVMADVNQAEDLESRLKALNLATQVLSGNQGLIKVASDADVDSVVAAIVGAAGLESTLAAVIHGKTVLLANKESLVMAGGLFMNAVADSGATLLPIDSEHNAIFQCLPQPRENSLVDGKEMRKILLTASGGPFRKWTREQMAEATVEQACAHPNWDMGRKISVDSATMMNKGLELIEACWLFDVPASKIEIVVHPQSIVHSMVEYLDGSVIAQMGNPDMRIPIAYGLAWPERMDSGVASLDLINSDPLDFEQPDYVRFPCLRLAIEAADTGGTAMTVLNAANEIAVEAFLAGLIKFTDISVLIEQALSEVSIIEPTGLDVVKSADADARAVAGNILKTWNKGR
jgi:1-deoxy-D-xylulose-5-phosphate reductoisomerase